MAAWLGATAALVASTARCETRGTPIAPSVAGYRLPQWPAKAPSPDFSLVDVEGRPRSLADYRGRAVVVFFGYARCPDICPVELAKLAQVMRTLGASSEGVQVLFITLDPERDTADLLKAYVAVFDSRFVALTGTPAQIDRAAARCLIQYARVPAGHDYSISHSTRLLLFDRAGRLALIGSTQTSNADLVHDLLQLAGGSPAEPPH